MKTDKSKIKTMSLSSTSLMLLLFSLVPVVHAAPKKLAVEPDYTKGEKFEDAIQNAKGKYSALGSTGAIGNIWVGRGGVARMIQIRSVSKGTPADGKLQEGDVILGIGNSTFTSDVRKALSAAITEAEKTENGGKLVLNVWRISTKSTAPITITLPVMGSFSTTTPWDCEKTQKLIDAAAKSIIENDIFNKPPGRTGKDKELAIVPPTPKKGHAAWLGAMGLLATGEEKYLPIVQQYVRLIGNPDIDLDWRGGGSTSWYWSYTNLLLTEYYLATGDEYVLPAIKEYSIEIAKGASDVGTFSHGMAYTFKVNGIEQKYPSAYGAMNQCSITCILSLVLAQKCGIKDPEVDRVVSQGLNFYRWYVDKGAIPYGDHEPWMDHDDNGKNSQAAVLFDLAGEKEPARYFTRTTLASYKLREQGHTGHFFSWQWGALGAARGGEEAAQSFIKNTRWFTELERRPGGGSVHQPQLDTNRGQHYYDWSTTGSRLMQHCLPRKKLYITGKGGSCMEPITGKELEESVAAAEFEAESLTTPQLLMALGDGSPIVRERAAVQLGKLKDDDVVKELIAMLDSPNRYARYGACLGLRYAGRGSEEAVDKMIKLLKDSDDLTLRYNVCTALRKFRPHRGPNQIDLGNAVLKAGPALLKQATIYEPEKDPMRKLHAEISSTLFYGGNVRGYWGYYPNGQGAEEIDSALKIAFIKSLLRNPNGGARGEVTSLYNTLTDDELKQVWGDIYCASRYQAPSGSMFAGGVRGKGLKLMANKGVKEGIPVGIDWALSQEGWGNGDRKREGIPPLLEYGKALDGYLPEIDKVLAGWRPPLSKNNQKDADMFKKKLEEALKNPAPKLISIKPFIETIDPKEFYTTELKSVEAKK